MVESSEKLQLESNFTQMPNEILEALVRTSLSQNESKIVFLVIRKTYGWHKRTDWIALSQIAEGTGIAKSNVCRTLKSLVSRNILTRHDSRHVGIQKEYEFWIQKKLSIPIMDVISSDNARYQ